MSTTTQAPTPPAPPAPTGSTKARRRSATAESPYSMAMAMTVLVIMAVYFLSPVYVLFSASTKSKAELAQSSLKPSTQFVDNLQQLFSEGDGIYSRWLLNSLLYAVGGAGIATLLAAMAGYALAKYQFRGRELIFNVVLGGVLMPATALALPLFLMFAKVNLTNTYWSVLLPSIVSPFGVYLSRVFAAASVPDELIEAGRLDGASEFRIFTGLATRLMAPALVTIFLFQFVVIWNNFFLPLIMLQDNKLYPVTLGLYSWQSQLSRVPTLQVAVIIGSLVSVVPLIITFLALQRFWRSGLAAGSLK
ncbi:carbohydrate ABC transporter permease [Nocardioides rubriscoriae]|uniref:carbohydrate ABC transporter permease n=1 Tax=Nocardioides rubriscoriae TaxID=642762 RepID=UPI001FE5E344|nr:carbohydrate ABC transporter permease [Nocardioides rubriscoriae]